MCYFIDGIFTEFWETHHSILKGIDCIAKQSGFMARNVGVACYFIQLGINILKATVTANSHFKAFYDRKELHVNSNKVMKCARSNLPSIVLNEMQQECDNHFKQWTTDQSSLHLIASEAPFVQLVCQHVFNFLISTYSVTTSFSKRDASLASLRQFLFSNNDPPSLKNSLIHEKHNSALAKNANIACFFDSNVFDANLNELVIHVKDHALPLPLTQSVSRVRLKTLTFAKQKMHRS